MPRSKIHEQNNGEPFGFDIMVKRSIGRVDLSSSHGTVMFPGDTYLPGGDYASDQAGAVQMTPVGLAMALIGQDGEPGEYEFTVPSELTGQEGHHFKVNIEATPELP